MFTVTRKGVTTHMKDGGYQDEGTFVPWSRVEGVSLEKRIAVGGGSGRVITVALTLSPGNPVPSEASAGGSPDPFVLHLDATTGNLRGKKLLAQIEEAFSRSGGGQAG